MAWKEQLQPLRVQAIKKAGSPWEPFSEDDKRFLALTLMLDAAAVGKRVQQEWNGNQSDANPAESLAHLQFTIELLARAYGLDLEAECDAEMQRLVRIAKVK